MTEKQKKDCKKIINVASASAAAVGGGLAQIPGSDRRCEAAGRKGQGAGHAAVLSQPRLRICEAER